ncbi:MAG: type I pullulanase [Clostridia bacterium]|nr:type I pullulanase [Clostridia bacterium]
MGKRIKLALLLVAIFSISLLGAFKATPVVRASDTVNLTFHYHRYAEDYSSWDIWVWEDGKDGAGLAFSSSDDFGKIATIEVPANSKIGFIVRKGNWAEKDISADRFIQIGNTDKEVWLIQGDAVIYTALKDADISPKFLSASFKNATTVTAKVTAPVTAENNTFTLISGEEEIPVTNATKVGTSTVTLNMANSVEYTRTYTVHSEYYGDCLVSMENLFSTKDFEEVYAYEGELGSLYTAQSTTFRVWSPFADEVSVNLYATGSDEEAGAANLGVHAMTKGEKGVWEVTVNQNLLNVYYTYSVKVNGMVNETVDIYAKAVGVNGKRGMVVNLDATDPEGWANDKFIERAPIDSIIYEAHVRDLTIDPSSGVSEANRGKFLGLTERGTKNSHGYSTALDHLIELGITEIHILPMFDYSSVDESNPAPQFNWGYDPLNYNVPEGSYSTNLYDGNVRITELKQMVMALHNAGIRVVMDVVYNHTSKSADSSFNLTVPGYYYRMANGSFLNGSGCGNETASERAMYRKFMIDSVKYWVEEYHIDGFRFDLMGLHDIETMNLISAELNKINPSVLLYGEGWNAGTSGLADSKAALKKNASKLSGIAVFSDDMRDAIKGSVFTATDKGFVSGKSGSEKGVMFGVYGSTKTIGGSVAWANAPTKTITYSSAHDNLTLFDKIASSSSASFSDRVKMNRLSAAIVYTSQGIPFIHAGEELLRSKVKEDGTFDENSYKSSDAVNSIKWDTKNNGDYLTTMNYYKGLIALRKAFPEFRYDTKEECNFNIWEMQAANGIVSYYIESVGRDIVVIYNSNTTAKTIDLGVDTTYEIYVEGSLASATPINEFVGQNYEIAPISATVLVRNTATTQPNPPVEEDDGCKSSVSSTVASMALLGAAAVVIKRKKK